jgi:hypothetical protein
MKSGTGFGIGALVCFVGCGDTNREEVPTTIGPTTPQADDGDDDGDDDGGETASSEGTGGGVGTSTGGGSDEGSTAPASIDFDTKWDVHPGATDVPNVDTCRSEPGVDDDLDGYDEAAGDCNDCDANVNPGAIEVEITEPDDQGVIPAPADEDCDGTIDNVAPPCDGAIALTTGDPMDGARAMGLCKVAANAQDWGVTNVEWVRANGNATNTNTNQFGVQWGFGTNLAALEGDQTFVMSTGRARVIGQANACGMESCTGVGNGTAPPGFPQAVPGCGVSNLIRDDVGLEVTLRAPTNAVGYAFSFSFYSFEYPEWVCDIYNDQFIAYVSPAPVGAINGNISFDENSNPVSVNIAYFDVCAGCPLGTAEMAGTGFNQWNDAGATSWLETTAPVTGGQEITIRFAIWDTGDAFFDSTVVIDNFRWIADGGTVSVSTQPEG